MSRSLMTAVGGRRIARTRMLLLERDGDRCGRCNQRIDMTLSGLLPNGPTIGHRYPASKGGSDYLDDLRLEHRRCNLAAGARITPPPAAVVRP